MVMQQRDAIARIMYEVCEDAAKDGIRYFEVRFSPILHCEQGLSFSSVMEAVIEGKEKAELKNRIVVRIIVCAMRQQDQSNTRKLAEIAWRYRNQGVVAFDLAGPEKGFSSKNHKEAFDLIHKRLVNCTIHSGEAAGWESIQDSIRFCGAQRIGHGVALRENPELLQYVANHRIPIEICVTSNKQTKAIQTFEEHPLRLFFDNGIVVVPCTDNTTVSSVTLSGEYLKIQKYYNFTIGEIAKLIDNGFKAAFVNPHRKKALRALAFEESLAIMGQEFGVNSPVYKDVLKKAQPRPFYTLKYSKFSQLEHEKYFYYYSSKLLQNEELLGKLIQQMPKADLNCMFSGSVSFETMFENCKEIQNEKWFQIYIDSYNVQLIRDSEKNALIANTPSTPDSPTSPALLDGIFADTKLIEIPKSVEDIRRLIMVKEKNRSIINNLIEFMSLFVQTPNTIKRGLDDVLKQAYEENVNYMELAVAPTLHTKGGMSTEQVLVTILDEIDVLCKEKYSGMTIVVNIVSNNVFDGLSQVKEMAILCVKYKKRIGGFMYHGIGMDLEPGSDLVPLFSFLKANEIAVSVVAAFKHPRSVIWAINDFGATRLSGCFSIYNDPEVMQYIANRMVPIEISFTDTYAKFTRGATYFVGSAIRLFVDSGVKALPCTFDRSLYDHSRTEMIMKMAKEAHMSLYEIVDIIVTPYKSAFASFKVKKNLAQTAEKKCLRLAEQFIPIFKKELDEAQ